MGMSDDGNEDTKIYVNIKGDSSFGNSVSVSIKHFVTIEEGNILKGVERDKIIDDLIK